MSAFRPIPMRQKGFTLIELMVALVAGLVVSGAVLAFTIASLRSNTEFVQATRLTQDLRTVIDYTSRELRRAGFDQAFADQVSLQSGSVVVSAFAPISLTGGGTATSCILYAYDRAPFTGGPAAGVVDLGNGEIRGIRRVTADVNGVTVGIVEVAESVAGAAAPACNDGTANYATYPASCANGWCPLTDPRTIDIQSFRITDTSPAQINPAGSASLGQRIRQFDVFVQGVLANDANTVRSVDTNIRVRADCLRANLTACDAAPTGV